MILVLPSLLAGCTCYSIKAPDRVTVALVSEDWEPGTWGIELQSGDRFAMCAVTLPLGDDALVSCTDNAEVELDETGSRVVSIAASDFAPSNFTVAVSREGRSLAEQQFVPDYRIDEPNGNGCGERSQATVSVRF